MTDTNHAMISIKRLSIDILQYINTYLDSVSSMQFASVSPYMYMNIRVNEDPSNMSPPDIKFPLLILGFYLNRLYRVVDVSYLTDRIPLIRFNNNGDDDSDSDNNDDNSKYTDNLRKIPFINPIWLKCRETDYDVDNQVVHDIDDMPNLQIIENIKLPSYNINSNILICKYNYSRIHPKGNHDTQYLFNPTILPYVLIYGNIHDKYCHEYRGDNIQILQIAKSRLIEGYYCDDNGVGNKANPYVLVKTNLDYRENENIFYNIDNRNDCKDRNCNYKHCRIEHERNMRCRFDCVKMDKYCVFPLYIMAMIVSKIKKYDNLEELYLMISVPERHMNGKRDMLDDIKCRLMAMKNIESHHRNRSKVKYIKVIFTCARVDEVNSVFYHGMRCSIEWFAEGCREYKPSLLSKIEYIGYVLTIDDVFNLYKHFNIPMTDKMRELSVSYLSMKQDIR